MDARQERMLRAALTAGVSTVATTLAHALAGGHVAPPPVLALVLAFSTLGAFMLGGARVTLRGRVLSVAASQALLHVAFTASAGAHALRGAGDPAAHAHHAGVAGSLVVAAKPAAAHAAAMPWLHVVAGALTVAALQSGTHALRSLARAVRLGVGVALRLATAPALVVARRPRVVPARCPRPRVLVRGTTVSRRGPPALAPAV
ncbi:hypothetical protein [Xylanimonas ulmi]|uniref:Uncharacterized protein n=1 Tax=Xylanimonas ulmi TaxID=228973 RepID=A0A4Q7LZI8_9MICO|nr:hypothetical protein [Xylanibacterium ulmi]RZS60221.1 hypothetical protein EV386_0473 [Xylanibacterium ulmi]